MKTPVPAYVPGAAAVKNIEVALLRSFVQVAECASFTQAAERNHKTQSAISVQMRKLEERLGQRLIDRSARQVRLTEQGELLLGYARQMLRLNDEAVSRLVQGDQRQQLRLGLVEYLAPHRLPSIVASLPGAFPQLDVSVKIDLSRRLRQDLAEGRLDVVIAARQADDGEGKVLFREPLVWASCDAALATLRPLPMAFLPAPCFYRDAACAGLDALGIPWHCRVTTMNVAGVQSVVRAGLAVGVLGRTSVLPGMRILNEKHGLPKLRSFDVALFTHPEVQGAGYAPLVDFLVQALSPGASAQSR